jgi:hypothetical protein
VAQHYNRPALYPIHIYIQAKTATPDHHTIGESGHAQISADSTNPYADAIAALRAQGVNAQTHVVVRSASNNRLYAGELADA